MLSDKFQVGLQDILQARQRLEGVIRLTPLVPSSHHPQLFFKSENLQITGAFKVRAAFNQIYLLSEEEKARGVVTSSSGNFAQAAAYAAGQLGVSAKIVMMESSNPIKVERTRSYGGEVVFCEDRFEARAETVEEVQSREGRTQIYPYDHPAAIAGNGTLALEIMGRLEEVENVVVPISGGGLISGVALGVKSRSPQVRIWGVQPRNSNATCLSFRAGAPLSIDGASTVADGLTVTRPGALTFPIIQSLVHDVVAVEEASILRAVRHFIEQERLVVEPSGAVPLAAVFENKIPLKHTVLVLSGGNISPSLLAEVLEG